MSESERSKLMESLLDVVYLAISHYGGMMSPTGLKLNISAMVKIMDKIEPQFKEIIKDYEGKG